MEKKQKKRHKKDFVDDGRTISNMNVEGMRWYEPRRAKTNTQTASKKEGDDAPQSLLLTKKERSAIVRAGMGMALKFSLFVIGIFFVVVLLLRVFWLR